MPRSVSCHLALLLCLLVAGEWLSSAQGQALKPEVLVLPVKFAGVGDANAREILQQYVLTELSGSYELKSEREVAAARERAVDKLASSDCTEEACLKVMGELLDVDYTFAVSVTASGDFWDLTGIRMESLGRTVRKNISCERCTLPKAKARLTELLLGLRPGMVGIERGKAVLILESEPSGLVFLEGVEQGETPIELTVPTDRPAEIFVFAEGYQDYSNLFDLKPGERRTVQIRLVKRRGRVRIVSEPPGAAIFLDGQPLRDVSEKQQSTPTETRLEYGKHTLRLTLEKHQDFRETLTVNRPDLGTKTYTLTPNPGRLIVRVPPEFKKAEVYVNDRKIGDMGEKIAKGFEVPAKVSLKVQARQGDFESDPERVKVDPEGTEKVEFDEFSDVRLIAARQAAERQRKEEAKPESTPITPEIKHRLGLGFGSHTGGTHSYQGSTTSLSGSHLLLPYYFYHFDEQLLLGGQLRKLKIEGSGSNRSVSYELLVPTISGGYLWRWGDFLLVGQGFFGIGPAKFRYNTNNTDWPPVSSNDWLYGLEGVGLYDLWDSLHVGATFDLAFSGLAFGGQKIRYNDDTTALITPGFGYAVLVGYGF